MWVTQTAIKDATCEKCGCAYRYELVRRGQGAIQYKFKGKDFQIDPASQRVVITKEFAEQLRKAVDPVACPDCGWYFTAMVLELSPRYLHRCPMSGLNPIWHV